MLHEYTSTFELKTMNTYKFKCTFPGCGKSFKRKDYLIRHQFNHAPRKPFSCELCDLGFTRTDLLDKHKLSKAHKTKLAELSEGQHQLSHSQSRSQLIPDMNDCQHQLKHSQSQSRLFPGMNEDQHQLKHSQSRSRMNEDQHQLRHSQSRSRMNEDQHQLRHSQSHSRLSGINEEQHQLKHSQSRSRLSGINEEQHHLRHSQSRSRLVSPQQYQQQQMGTYSSIPRQPVPVPRLSGIPSSTIHYSSIDSNHTQSGINRSVAPSQTIDPREHHHTHSNPLKINNLLNHSNPLKIDNLLNPDYLVPQSTQYYEGDFRNQKE
ncbi:unnamed protein product [Ambrosiozyma monospora]|uniref:Unnamed protein product n=1 Tax=Ambrosiozyma monospora TaxID=43982 RepID=A0ACB5SXX0_AMBMO|nr:unnamed protein product [Ambrosiozyma monospora]